MKRILLCMALLLMMGLCGSSVHADTAYTPSTIIAAPTNGASYYVYYPNNTIQIPVSITNQYVKVMGATPSAYISIGWSLADWVNAQSGGGPGLADDYTSGLQPVMTDMSGNFQHNLNNGSGSLSVNLSTSPGSYTLNSQTILEDSSGQPHSLLEQVQFRVVAHSALLW